MGLRISKGIIAGIGMLVLILDSRTAIQGGLDGLRVCFMTVVPSLLPFLVLSILLTSSLSGVQLRLLRPLGQLCSMPAGSEPLLLLGLLGGYPAGAQAVSQAYRAGQLSAPDAKRLLGFCNNAGPSFLFGIAAAAFAQKWMPWALWGIHIVSAVITGILLPGSALSVARRKEGSSVTIPQAVEQAVKIMARICAWIILFRILLAFCDRWFLWLFGCGFKVLFTGTLELANGCLQLHQIPCVGLRFMICSGILSLGGISVAMQTLSVTGSLGFGMYLPGKLIQCTASVMIAYLVQLITCGTDRFQIPTTITLAAAALFVLFLLFVQKRKNNSGNPAKVIV